MKEVAAYVSTRPSINTTDARARTLLHCLRCFKHSTQVTSSLHLERGGQRFCQEPSPTLTIPSMHYLHINAADGTSPASFRVMPKSSYLNSFLGKLLTKELT